MEIDTTIFRSIIRTHSDGFRNKKNTSDDDEVKGMFEVDIPFKAGDYKVCIVQCVSYEQGVGAIGGVIIFNVLSHMEGVCVDFGYFPPPEIRSVLRNNKIPYFGFGTKHPIREFDMVGFSLFSYSNIFNMIHIMNLAGIPFLAKDRGEKYPLIIGGGPMMTAPEIIAPMFDIIFVGEGEDGVQSIVNTANGMRGKPKSEILKALSKIAGVYIPSLYENTFNPETKRYAGLKKLDPEAPDRIKFQKIDISDPKYDYTIQADSRNRKGKWLKDIEVSRGCLHGCRFCAPFTWHKPYRERTLEGIKKAIDSRIGRSDAIAMVGLTATDHSKYNEAIKHAQDAGFRINRNSERVDQFERTWEEMSEEKVKAVTLALECATERMRRVVNKGISDEQFWTAFRLACKAGVGMIKVFCISGLPFEEKEDTLALQKLQDDMFEVIKETGGKSSFDLNLTLFIPKAHTPFQWARCAESPFFSDFIKVYNDSFYESRYWLWDEVDQRKKVKGYTTIKQSRNHTRIQVLFDNGDRRMTMALIRIVLKYKVWNDESGGGANNKIWWGIQTIMLQEYGYDIDELLNVKGFDHIFPHEHIDLGTSKQFLWNEYQKASRAEETVPCRDGCAGCGIMKECKDEAKYGVCFNRQNWFPHTLDLEDSNNLSGVSDIPVGVSH